MLLAADVGGTKTLLGLFARAPERPKKIEHGEFITLDYDDLAPMIREFLKANAVEPRMIEAATFGVAGAITDQVARLTNVPWVVDAAAITGEDLDELKRRLAQTRTDEFDATRRDHGRRAVACGAATPW